MFQEMERNIVTSGSCGIRPNLFASALYRARCHYTGSAPATHPRHLHRKTVETHHAPQPLRPSNRWKDIRQRNAEDNRHRGDQFKIENGFGADTA